ncbi:MAG: hypothetical protein IJ640_03215 [Prevotella sp.]|nr:hypothetical protein [Prevotella sp.]
MDTLIHEEELCQAQSEEQACVKARMPYVRPMTEVVSIAGGEMLFEVSRHGRVGMA